MSSEEIPTKELGDLKVEESEKFEDTTETPSEESPEDAKEAVLEELTESPPKLHHVETEESSESTEGEVVKSEVPEAFEDELKKDHDIVPEEKPTTAVESTASETGAESGASDPATRDVPVEVTHTDVDAPKKSFSDKISDTLHKITGKD